MLTRRFPVSAATLPAFPAFGDFDRMIDNLFNSAFEGGEVPVPFGPRAFPALNIWQDEQNVLVEAELPGFTMEQVEISLTGRDLTIQAQRSTDTTEGDEKTWLRRERSTGQFSRTVRLPVSVNSEEVCAKLADGVLTITLPKAAEAKARKITVKTS